MTHVIKIIKIKHKHDFLHVNNFENDYNKERYDYMNRHKSSSFNYNTTKKKFYIFLMINVFELKICIDF